MEIHEAVRLIAIPPADMDVEQFADACRAAVRGGATAVQVRLKDQPASRLLGLTEELVATLPVPVFVNDRADIARMTGAGAHIGADDLMPVSIRRVLPRPAWVGVSVGSEGEAEAAKIADADYWSIGPFRATGTKRDAGAALGPAGFARLAAHCPRNIPVIAIGGIATDNVAAAIHAGARGVAVIGSIFGRPDIESATRALREQLDAA